LAHVSGPKYYIKTPAAWEIMLGRRRRLKWHNEARETWPEMK